MYKEAAPLLDIKFKQNKNKKFQKLNTALQTRVKMQEYNMMQALQANLANKILE